MGQGRILIVDDDVANLMTLGANLELAGFEVVEAESLAQARAALGQDGNFAWLLLDHNLGDGKGFELLPELEPFGCRASTVLMSGDAETLESLDDQFDCVFLKGQDPGALILLLGN